MERQGSSRGSIAFRGPIGQTLEPRGANGARRRVRDLPRRVRDLPRVGTWTRSKLILEATIMGESWRDGIDSAGGLQTATTEAQTATSSRGSDTDSLPRLGRGGYSSNEILMVGSTGGTGCWTGRGRGSSTVGTSTTDRLLLSTREPGTTSSISI